MNDTRKPLQIAIAGAGIAGLATAIAITRSSGLENPDIQLFEQAIQLEEIGASIALSPNGMRTLEKLGVANALDDNIGYRGPSGIPQIFRHWKTNQVVSVDTHHNVPNPRHHTTRFHRGHLHSALLEHVPSANIHLGKRVSKVQAREDRIVLYFDDGTHAEADLLIGADGIRSKVRQTFSPEDQLKFTGKVFMRATFDASLLEGKIPNLPKDSMHWWGPKDNFFASRLGKNQYTTVGACQDTRTADEIEKSISWNDNGDVHYLRERFKDWNPVVKALVDHTPSVRLFPNFAGEPLPTWVLGPRTTLVGDAAHTHGGAFAAGGSLALDDAYALALSMKHVFESSSSGKSDATDCAIEKALHLYDQVRRPHGTRLQRIVHGIIDKASPSFATPEEEDAALLSRMRSRPDTLWLTEHDVERAFQDVISSLEASNGGNGGCYISER